MKVNINIVINVYQNNLKEKKVSHYTEIKEKNFLKIICTNRNNFINY